MHTRLGFVLLAGFALACACSTPNPAPPVDAALSEVTVLGLPEAAVSYEGGGAPSPLQTSVRVALLSPLSFGIDICLTSVVTDSVQGPLLKSPLPSLPDAGYVTGGHDAAIVDAAHDAKAHDARAKDGGPRPFDAGSTRIDGGGEDGSEGGSDAAKRPDADGTALPDARVSLDGARDAQGDGSRDATSGALDSATDASSVADGGERVGGVLAWQVSNYLTVQGAGTFNVAIVVGGSSSCSCPLFVQRITLDAGKRTTLVVLASSQTGPIDGGVDAGARDASALVDAAFSNDASRSDASRTKDASVADAAQQCPLDSSLSIVQLTDEPLANEPPSALSLAHARFFNATAFRTSGDAGMAAPLRVVAVEQTTTVPLAKEVPRAGASWANPANPAIDSLGYWSGPPLASTSPIDIRVGGLVDADASVDGGVSLPAWTFASTHPSGSFDLIADTNHTGFIVGGGSTPPALLWCDDNITSASALTPCVLVTAQ